MWRYLKPSGLALAAATLAAAPLGAQELSGTLKKIKDTGSITIGHRDASIPFSYYDDKQRPVGFAMDICARVVDAIVDVGAEVDAGTPGERDESGIAIHPAG